MRASFRERADALNEEDVVKPDVDLYDSHYGAVGEDIYVAVRREAFGEDLGQASWITEPEARHFFELLDLSADDSVLEVACGSGGVSRLMAKRRGARVLGIDINRHAIGAASARAAEEGVGELVEFQVVDAAGPLPLDDASFDALFCNDAIDHLPDRESVLKEWFRVLRPGGRLLYTDPIVVTGIISNEEMAIRSSVGFYLFVPSGENERLLEAVGFELLDVEDSTRSVAVVGKRWHEARARRREELLETEGEEEYEGLQRFLSLVHRLADEGRLSRHTFLARKP